MPRWPSTLPQAFFEEGFRQHAPDGLARTQLDGAESRRRRSTATPQALRGVMRMSQAQLEAFETFFYEDIANGVYSFELPEPGETGRTLVVAFAQPPSWTAEGETWLVNMRLTIEHGPF